MRKATITLALAEVRHLLGCLHSVKTSGEYWGNRKQFQKRHEKLYAVLVYEVDRLTHNRNEDKDHDVLV